MGVVQMVSNNQDLAALLTAAYKGIEGFYILNRNGGLGYFSTDGQRLMKETFVEDLPTPEPPELREMIEAFFSELRKASANFPPGEHKELGYLTPIDEKTVWNSATLVFHDYVIGELRDAFDRDIKQGRMSLAEGDRKVRDMEPERGVHRGTEDLLNHIGSFGTHTFFPVLYYRADEPGERLERPMRVVNLLSLITGTGGFPDLLAKMRRNLQERGALNQASRVEHRFTLEGEEI